MFFLLVLCIIKSLNVVDSLNNDSTTEKVFRSDYIYDEGADGWFKVHPVPVDWQTARLICHHEGAELASPLNAAMLESIKNLVEDTEPKLKLYYSGLHQTFGDGVYMTVEGIPLEKLPKLNWSAGEPNNYAKSQQCLLYSNDRTIWDNNCLDYLPYICFRKFSTNDNLTNCGTVDREYVLNDITGHCYKYHKHAVVWEQAHIICQAEGGYLAIINSEEEARALRVLIDISPQPMYTLFKSTVLIGFHEWGAENSWWTVHGQTLEEAGFEIWGTGLPENAAFPYPGKNITRSSCGGFRNGKLDDLWCDVPFGYICEKTTDSLTDEIYN